VGMSRYSIAYARSGVITDCGASITVIMDPYTDWIIHLGGTRVWGSDQILEISLCRGHADSG